MNSQPSEFKYIVLDPAGTAFIEGTTLKVRELVLEHIAYGWSAEQLNKEHPYLRLSQIHAALAYYFDRKTQIDQEIQLELDLIKRMDAQWQSRNAELVNRLKEMRSKS
jgi:uncharacterized protein (DUF433 family)